IALVRGLLEKYGIPQGPAAPASHDEIAASLNPRGAEPLLEVAFGHRISLIASALGTPPAGLVDRAKKEGVAVAALVGQARHARRQLDAGVGVLVAPGTEAGGPTRPIATPVLPPANLGLARAPPAPP